MVEDLSNKFLDSQFNDDGGNLYKPDGSAATWTHFSEDDFIKKTNEEEADWTDIQTAISALHASRSDAEAWRTELERSFNVYSYLKLLAVNQTMQNWDTYGSMTHNYYLYGDPDDNGRLVWIPWDLNECMLSARGGPGGSSGFGGGSILLNEVSDDWPVIRYLLDDPVYAARYYEELATLLDGAFAIEKVQARMQELHALISPWVVGEEGEASPYTLLRSPNDFNDALTSNDNGLLPHVETRHDVVEEALRAAGAN